MNSRQKRRSSKALSGVRRRGLGFAVMILTGVLALAFGCGRDSGDPDETGRIVIARAGGRDITVEDLESKLRIQFASFVDIDGPAGIAQRREVLRAMVEQLVWVGEGERLGFENDPEFKMTMEFSRHFVLSKLTIKNLVHEKAIPTEDEMREYYEENLDQFWTVTRLRASHILLPTRAEAERVRNLALQGVDFAELSHRYSLDEASKAQDGNVGPISENSTIRGFSSAESPNYGVMHLEVGQISEPLETSRGWSIFRVDERVDGAQRSFDHARAQIMDFLTNRNTSHIFASTLAHLREQTGTDIDEDGWLLYTARFLSEDDLFRVANTEKSPERRIQIYEMVRREHPHSPRSVQALFMIGFAYAENLEDFERARAAFREILDLHSDHELAASARWMIENMERGLENLPQTGEIRSRALSL